MIYRPTTSMDQTSCRPDFGQRRDIQYVDACNGELIWSKVMKKDEKQQDTKKYIAAFFIMYLWFLAMCFYALANNSRDS